MEPLDRTPMEMVRVVIDRTVVAASAAADEDADAADAVAAAEAKAAIERVVRRAARKAVGQKTRSLPKPLRRRRVTVVTIKTTVARAKARTNSRVFRRNLAKGTTSRSKHMSRSSRMSRNRLVSHSRSIVHPSLSFGLRNRTIGRLSLSSETRLLRLST
jgi:hypothetical protein